MIALESVPPHRRPLVGTGRGFSLIELLVVVAVVAILAAMAVPSFDAMIERNRLAAAHNEVLSALYLLRSEAAKRNRVVRMCRIRDPEAPLCDTAADGGWHTGWALWVDRNGSGQIDAGETAIGVHGPLGGGVRVIGNATVVNRIGFQPSGATSGVSNGTFTVCLPGSARKRQIIVSKAGRLRTADLASDGSC